MNRYDEREREIRELRERLSRLSEASLRVNESLDFDAVLQGVLDSARSLTGARYGVMTLLDDSGAAGDFLSSGMSAEEEGRMWEVPEGAALFEYLGGISEPLRIPDLLGHVRSLGFPGFRLPLPVGPAMSFLAMPVLHRGERMGNIYVGEKETLMMSALGMAVLRRPGGSSVRATINRRPQSKYTGGAKWRYRTMPDDCFSWLPHRVRTRS